MLNYCEAAGPSHALFNQFFDVIVVLVTFRLKFFCSIEICEKKYNFEHVYRQTAVFVPFKNCKRGRATKQTRFDLAISEVIVI